MDAKKKLERFDSWQRRRRWSAVGTATVKKFQEDQTTNLAGVIAFWAFFSIFPLLLAFVTILGYVLPSDVKDSVLRNVAGMLPVLNPNTVGHLTGSWWALLLGLATALWSGMGVVRTAQSAFSSIWEIPVAERPNIVVQTLRSLKILGTVGVGLVLSTVVTSFVSSTSHSLGLGAAGRVAGYAIGLVLDVALFVAAFRMLTHRDITTRQVVPGAVLSGVAFWVLQMASSLIISRYTQNAADTYKGFATVITMLWWFYLNAVVTLLGAQLNVVLTHRLWPRSLVGKPDTRADREAYEAYARERTYHEHQQVRTTFDDDRPAAGETRSAES